MKRKRLWGILVLLILAESVLFPSVVRYGMGGRALGMGNAVVGFSDDISSVYWNPAGIDQLQHRNFMAQYDNMSLERRYHFLSAAFPHALGGTIAFSWQSAWLGGLEQYDDSGNFLGYFENTDDTYYFTYGNQINKWFSVGLNLKYRYIEYMKQYKGDGFGVDLGFLFTLNDKLSLGLSIRDISTSLRWDGNVTNTIEDLPTEYAVGIAYRPLPYFLMDLDFSKVSHEEMKTRFGVEVWFKNAVGIRAGTDDGRLSLGASVKLRKWTIDYAYKNGELDDINRVSATVDFDDISQLASSFALQRDKELRDRKVRKIPEKNLRDKEVKKQVAKIKKKESPEVVQKKIVMTSRGEKMVTKSTVIPEKQAVIVVADTQPKLSRVETVPQKIVKVEEAKVETKKAISEAPKLSFKEPLPEESKVDPLSADSKVAQKYRESAEELFKKGEVEKALEDILTAIRLDPYNGEFYFFVSKIYRKQGKMDKALNALKQATTLSPEKQEYYISLGNLYDARGEKVKAIREYKKAISLDPNSRWAKIARRMIKFMSL